MDKMRNNVKLLKSLGTHFIDHAYDVFEGSESEDDLQRSFM